MDQHNETKLQNTVEHEAQPLDEKSGDKVIWIHPAFNLTSCLDLGRLMDQPRLPLSHADRLNSENPKSQH